MPESSIAVVAQENAVCPRGDPAASGRASTIVGVVGRGQLGWSAAGGSARRLAALGLSILAAVAAAHGGSAKVESKRGVGTRVKVELPLLATGRDGGDRRAGESRPHPREAHRLS
jgi:hypothetical protein